MNVKVKDNKVYFNGISAVFEAKDKEGNLVKDKDGNQVYNFYVKVPREFSRKGDVVLSSSYLKDDAYVEGAKSVGFNADYELNVKVYSYYNENEKDKSKSEVIKITAGDLAAKAQEYLNAKKAKDAEKEAEDVEADEPEIE